MLSYFMLATVVFAGLFMYACKKQEVQQTPVPQVSAVVKKITKFRDKIDQVRDHSYTRSGNENITIDSAKWYLEAVTNYTYSDPAFEHNQMLTDSAVVSVSLSNGGIDIAEIQVVYDSLVQALANYNANIEAENKRLLMMNLVFDSISLRENDKAVFKMYYCFGGEVSPSASTLDGVSWYWAYNLGRCEPGGEFPPPHDAAKRIAMFASLSLPDLPPNTFFVDLSEIEPVKPHDFLDANNETMLFYLEEEGSFYHPCITEEEIIQYSHNVTFIGNELKPYPKDVVTYEVKPDVKYMPQDYIYELRHLLKITYGTLIQRIDPIDDFPTD